MPNRTGDANISDQAVRTKTGKGWEEWFRILDRFDVKKHGHKAAAKHLSEKHGVSDWWCQMITVQYERERGLREVNQRPDGYQLSVSRVIAAPVGRAWDALATTKGLNAWFTHSAKQEFVEGGEYSNGDGDHGVFRRINDHKNIRFTWNSKHHKPGSVVEVRFYPKGDDKCQVVLQHMKLASKKEVDDLREAWSWALDSLRSYLEAGKGIRFEEWKKATASRGTR